MTPQEAEELAVLWTNARVRWWHSFERLRSRNDESEELLQRTAVVLVRKFHESIGVRRSWAGPSECESVLATLREKASDRLVFNGELVEQIADGYTKLAEDRFPVRDLLIQCVAELENAPAKAIQLRYADEMKTSRWRKYWGCRTVRPAYC